MNPNIFLLLFFGAVFGGLVVYGFWLLSRWMRDLDDFTRSLRDDDE